MCSDALPKTPPLLYQYVARSTDNFSLQRFADSLSSPPRRTRQSASISLSAAGKVVLTTDKPKGNRLSRFFSTKLFGNWFGSLCVRSISSLLPTEVSGGMIDLVIVDAARISRLSYSIMHLA